MGDRSHREQLYETFAERESDVDDRIARGLDLGAAALELPYGFLTRIDGDTQRIVASTGDHELLQPGESCPLEEAYCRRTVELDGSLAVQHAAESAAVPDAALETFGLETYVGAKVLVDDEVYGTVCFADRETRAEPFAETETMFVELLARLVGQALERRERDRERRERNERLEREKRRFEGIADASFDVVFRLGLDGEFTYVSSAVERVLGYPSEEVVDAQFARFVAASSVDDATTAYARLLDGETVEARELEFLADDGTVVTLEVNATPVTEDGAVVAVQGVGRDVTARKERERELRLKTRAMDEASIGITIADANRSNTPLVYANEGFERLTGYGADELLGRNCRFLQGPATDDDPVARLREGIAAADPVSTELVNYRSDGTPFWNQVRVSPVADESGEVTRFLGFQADVIERKRTEQLVRLLNRVLRHNLRNEMNVVLGIGSHLRDGGHGSHAQDGDHGGRAREDGDDPAALGERLTGTADRMVALSERARELERYARTDREPERLDPERVLSDVAARYREQFPAATVDVAVETDYGVCAGRELDRAVGELLENALKHGTATDSRVRVEAHTVDGSPASGEHRGTEVAADGGAWVELLVEDDGPGIPETEAAVIERGEETPLEHGSGLGLWLVNWVVTRYGGSCQVHTPEDTGGTRVSLRLPAIDADTPVAEAARPPTVLFR